MVGKLAAASAALGLVSAASAINLDPNAKTLALNFHRRAPGQVAPTSAMMKKRHLAKRSGSVQEDLSWGDLLYYINITMGTPGQPSAVWIDTGSSDLWLPDTGSNICSVRPGCAGNGGFDPQNSDSYETVASNQFQIQYASGDSLLGDYGQDKLSMDNADIDKMIFGVVDKGKSSEPISGIMGVGYQAGEAIVSETYGQQSYPNIVDNLLSAGIINSRSYSLWLNDLENGHGTILFGGVDSAKYDGGLGIVDVQKNTQTGNFDTFTVVLSEMTFTANGKDNNLAISGGGLPVILDSGTTLTYLPNEMAQAIYDGLGVSYSQLEGAYVPCNVDTSNMYFTFTFGGAGGVPIQVGLGQFLLPYDPTVELPDSNGEKSCTFGLMPAGSVSQGGGDILFGDTFLRSAYVVYDLDNNQIGLAQTKFDVSDSNVQDIGTPSQTVNTIPGATTVNAEASVAQSNSEFAGATADPTDGGTAFATAGPTFAGLPDGGLQTGTTTAVQALGTTGGSGSSTSSSSASSLRIPPVDLSGMVTIGAAGLIATFAGSVFLAAL